MCVCVFNLLQYQFWSWIMVLLYIEGGDNEFLFLFNFPYLHKGRQKRFDAKSDFNGCGDRQQAQVEKVGQNKTQRSSPLTSGWMLCICILPLHNSLNFIFKMSRRNILQILPLDGGWYLCGIGSFMSEFSACFNLHTALVTTLITKEAEGKMEQLRRKLMQLNMFVLSHHHNAFQGDKYYPWICVRILRKTKWPGNLRMKLPLT